MNLWHLLKRWIGLNSPGCRHRWMVGAEQFHNLAKWDGICACRWCDKCGETQMRYSKRRSIDEIYPKDPGYCWWEVKTDSYRGMRK